MLGLMSDRPLLVSQIIAHAARVHGDVEIVSQTVEGPIHRYTYAEAEKRAKRLGNALRRLGIDAGDRVGTLAWNTFRHFELYYGVAGIGAVCHTINPRLFEEQIAFIIGHAQDRVLFADLTCLPLLQRLAGRLPPECRIILLTDDSHLPGAALAPESGETLPVLASYESLIAAESEELDWPELDERSAAALCYTSGTTGNPKGALYSHRSTVLHAFAISLPDMVSLSARETVCPVVPMFHVNAWGSPFAAPMTGATLVVPGPRLDGASLHRLFQAEGVTLSLGVPTVWMGFAAHLDDTGQRNTSLKRILSGGSAVPAAMIRDFAARGITIQHGWGMTEMSPVGAAAALKGKHESLDPGARAALLAKQGRPPFGVEMMIVDEAGDPLPADGAAAGELLVRGPWVIGAYYEDAAASREAFAPGGWFRTGDIATLDPDGFMQIMDRRKDVIKSGGEWISSIDLENAAVEHLDVAEAAAIAMPHPRWGERPLLIVAPRPGRRPDPTAVIAFLGERFPRWMVPDAVIVIDELPHTATGKVLKSRLREMFRDRGAAQPG